MTELDALDQVAADVFPGYVVRKDLAKKFKDNYPVPTYVAEFLIGKYCATTDEDEIKDGLEKSSASLVSASSVQESKNSTKHRQRCTAQLKS